MARRIIQLLMKAVTKVVIDGRTFIGRSIVINEDRVIIDGIEQSGSLVGPVNIIVSGHVELIDGTFGSVTVQGSCESVKTMSGDVKCGDVYGPVSTLSGDVDCSVILGHVKTMSGDIIRR